jgi:hypothetical protein
MNMHGPREAMERRIDFKLNPPGKGDGRHGKLPKSEGFCKKHAIRLALK